MMISAGFVSLRSFGSARPASGSRPWRPHRRSAPRSSSPTPAATAGPAHPKPAMVVAGRVKDAGGKPVPGRGLSW